MKSPSKIVLLTILLVCATCTHAQTTAPHPWKKRVERTIDLAQKEDTIMHWLRDAEADSSLVEMLTNAVLDGNLTAYQPQDVSFLNPLPWRELQLPKEILASDSMVVVDPVSGEEIKARWERYTDWSTVQKLRILEDWVYYPTGQTEVQIVGISPVRDILSSSGEHPRQQLIYWAKYKDARKIIDRYEQHHPGNTLALHIWNDYFLSDTKPSPVK